MALKSLESIIKSYSFITEEGADKYQFFVIKQIDDTSFKINSKAFTLKNLRKLASEETGIKLDLKAKRLEVKPITRFLTAIVEVANNE